MKARGWSEVDIVFVTGDAYIDHPSFAMAILARSLEYAGFKVAMLSQPDWKSVEPWRQFGRPKLFFAISAGNLDSLINHYTANKKSVMMMLTHQAETSAFDLTAQLCLTAIALEKPSWRTRNRRRC